MELIQRKPVPQDRLKMLSFTVGDAFCRDRYLTSVTTKLYGLGIIRLGQLVSLSEDELTNSIRTTPANLERMKDRLAEFGLELNMAVTEGSYEPVPSFLAKMRPH